MKIRRSASPFCLAVSLLHLGLGLRPATGQLVGPEFRVNTYTADAQAYPAIAADDFGNFLMVWQSSFQDGAGLGVFGKRYDSTGMPVGNEFRINTYTTSQQFSAAVAADGAGNFVVVWHGDLQDGSGWGVFGQRYDSAGLPVGGEFQVNSYTTGHQYSPAVAADDAGDFVVVWQSNLQDGSAWGIFGQRYDSTGTPLGSEFQVNTYTPNTQGYPAVTADGPGSFVVSWQSELQDGSGWGVFAQRYDPAGSPAGSEFRVNTYTANAQAYPAMAADDLGNFVVVWQSNLQDGSGSGVFGQRYDPAGIPAGSEFRVNSYTTGDQSLPAAVADGLGQFAVVWRSDLQDGSMSGVFGQRYTPTGIPFRGEFRVNSYTTSDQVEPAVAADASGNFVTAWQSNGQDGSGWGVFGQRFGTAQEPLRVGPQFQVNSYTTGNQVLPAISVADDGRFVLAWTGGGSSGTDHNQLSVQSRQFQPDGLPLGSDFQINSFTTGEQRDPDISVGPLGDFIVVWGSDGSAGTDNSMQSVQGRLYSSAGTPVTAEFQVNTITTNQQQSPGIARLDSGHFAVVWESFTSPPGPFADLDPFCIEGQLFDTNGVKVGGEFLVNTYTFSYQGDPAIAADAAGNFVVVWTSFGSSLADQSGSGILAQRFNSFGARVGAEFQINNYTTQAQNSPSVAMEPAGDFVVVWGSNGSAETDSYGYSVQGRRFSSGGLPLGDQFQVNTYTTFNQMIPSVAVNALGAFVVVWQNSPSGGFDIQGKAFDSNGVAIGTDFRVNAYPAVAGSADYPEVAFSPTGEFIATWHAVESAGSDTSAFSVQAQRFSYCGDAVVQGGLGEECDDGGAVGGDGCSATCQLEPFSDGFELGDTCAWSASVGGGCP